MSLRLDPTQMAIRDAAGNLVASADVGMIPLVQEVSLTNVDVAFPDVSKSVGYQDSFTLYDSSANPDKYEAWCYTFLQIDKAAQSGSINLAAITAGLAPNVLLANVKCSRTVDPNESAFGPCIKAVIENTWLPIRSGVRLEYNSWLRRIIWFDVAGGFLRLNWKQSTKAYYPAAAKQVISTSDRGRLKVPPGYEVDHKRTVATYDQLTPTIQGFKKRHQSNGWDLCSTTPPNVSFASTWRFSINAWLCQY